MLLKVAKIHANWGSTQVFNAMAFLVSSDLSAVTTLGLGADRSAADEYGEALPRPAPGAALLWPPP
jgi:hypothetical protein